MFHSGLFMFTNVRNPRGQFLFSLDLYCDEHNLGLFKVIFYFPNGKFTMTGESIVLFFFGGTPE